MAAGLTGTGIWAQWIGRGRRQRAALAGLQVAQLPGFRRIGPSHDREWRPEVAVLPRAVIDGDVVRLTGFRNFDYRDVEDFTARFEERQYRLSKLQSVDLFVSYWRDGPMAHTFVSFNFEDAAPLCISIETRLEAGERFAPVASMFKRFELIYVVGDERDIVGVRANHRGEDVYLYPLTASPEGARRLLLVYLERLNALHDQPEWYHLLSNSCTINIARSANRAGRAGSLDIRHLLNGYVDRYLYETGLVDTSLPFEELRRRSLINEAARDAAGAADFSGRIRAGLPTSRPAGSAR